MVGVEVSDVEVVDLDEAGRALHLTLGAFAAVDEDAIRRPHGLAGTQ